MLTLRQLQAFSAAAKSLSFTAAAQRLSITQSAISLLIRDLESHLGVQLFERGRHLRLTEAGESFVRSADKLIADLEIAITNLRDADANRRSVLRIGIGHLLAATLLPPVVKAFRLHHPSISIEIHDCLVEQLPRRVLDREVDFAIGSLRPAGGTAELRCQALFEDSIHVTTVGARGRHRTIDWRSLRESPMILVNAGNRIWSAAQATLATHGIELSVAHQVALYSTGIGLARAGQGRLLLPGFCSRAADLRDLGITPLQDPVVRWDVSVLYRRGAPPGAHATELIENLRQSVVQADR